MLDDVSFEAPRPIAARTSALSRSTIRRKPGHSWPTPVRADRTVVGFLVAMLSLRRPQANRRRLLHLGDRALPAVRSPRRPPGAHRRRPPGVGTRRACRANRSAAGGRPRDGPSRRGRGVVHRRALSRLRTRLCRPAAHGRRDRPLLPRRLPHGARRRRPRPASRRRLAAAPVRRGRRLARRSSARPRAPARRRLRQWRAARGAARRRLVCERRGAVGAQRRDRPRPARARRADRPLRRRRAARGHLSRRSSSPPLSSTCTTRWRPSLRARRLLAPGGLVAVLFLPRFDAPQARLFGARWVGLDLPRHLYHFEPRTFAATARAAGLRVVATEPYSRRHSPAFWTASLVAGAAEAAPQPDGAARAAAGGGRQGRVRGLDGRRPPPRARRSRSRFRAAAFVLSRRRVRLMGRGRQRRGARRSQVLWRRRSTFAVRRRLAPPAACRRPCASSSTPMSVSWIIASWGSKRTCCEPQTGQTGCGASVGNSSPHDRQVAAIGALGEVQRRAPQQLVFVGQHLVVHLDRLGLKVGGRRDGEEQVASP